MYRRASRIVTAWSAALLQFLFCIGFASDVVLCVATDGHVALEIPHAAGPCYTDYDRHHADSSRLDIIDIEHHGCRDTLLSQPAAWRNEERAAASMLAPTAAAVLALVPRPPVPMRYALELTPNRSTVGQLTRLRTIVLLV
jgi:hypothetical protein